MADTFLTRAFSSAGNRQKFTISVWLKQAFTDAGGNFVIFSAGSASNTYCQVRIKSNDYFQFEDEQGGSVKASRYTDSAERDPTAWSHLVVRVDTTQGTDSNRLRFYKNGQLMNTAGGNYPDQNESLVINNNVTHAIGTLWRGSDSGGHWDGYMSQFIFCDGQSYAPTSFAESNSDGVWVPITAPSVTYGSNGFKLMFQSSGASGDASGLGADTSGNNNHFATTNIGTNPSTKDSPTNNFCYPNSASNFEPGSTFADAGLKLTMNSSRETFNTSTFRCDKGKWYHEVKFTSIASAGTLGAGWAAREPDTTSQFLGNGNLGVAVLDNGQKRVGGAYGTYGSAFSNGDIMMIAADLDAGNFYFGKNGQWGDGSGNFDESNFSNAAAIAATNTASYAPGFSPAVGSYSTSYAGTVECNFGNPSFTIASGNADANGYGNFEYAVPTNYYSLCTKNLATYG